MPRSYNKTSAYWAQRRAPINVSTPAPAPIQASFLPHIDTPVAFAGDRQVVAACGGGRGTSYVDNWAPTIANNNLYPNLRAGIMPFSAEGGYYSMSIPINMATLAYFNIALVRNTINLLQDFSISPLHIRTGNRTVKTFFTKWFESINLNDLMSQWFLEYYRSGNIFLYAFNGKIAEDKFAKMKTATAAKDKSPEIPIRYIILDPKQVYLQVGPTYNKTYVRQLSTFEIERLRNPKTPEDRQMLKDYPPDIQRQIKQYSAQPWIYAPLDTSRLYYNFYRKQDYEPLAVPMIWPLLNRIEYKLMLEQADMSLVQTMEQVFMLITAGSEPDRTKGNPGTNPAVLRNLENIFKNQTIGRYLISDYTTKAEWKVPDLKELLGKGKYEQVDKDIRDGLGYQFFGEDKFANAAIKARLFTESLKEGRRVFLDNFLRPEIKKVCESLGFKNVPLVQFEEIDVSDQTGLQRIYGQMAQMGLLTPEQLNEALNTGLLPDPEAIIPAQEEYKVARDKGLFVPLAPPKLDGEQGRPAGTKTKSPGKKVGTRASFDAQRLVHVTNAMTNICEEIEATYRKQHKLKKLNDTQQMLAKTVARSIVLNEPDDKWQESVAAYVAAPKLIAPEVTHEISRIATEYSTTEHPIDTWMATALFKSQNGEVEIEE